jgi:4-hydroxy-2-oxoglutarate aldolase
MAAVVPDLCVRLYDLFAKGRREGAKKLQLKLTPLNKALTQTMGIPAIKYAMDLLGYSGGPPRSPLLPLHAGGRKRIQEMLRELGLLG